MKSSRDVTPTDLAELVQRCELPAVRGLLNEFIEDGTEDYDGRLVIVDGDCVIDGDLHLEAEEIIVLVVLGDLVVRGTYCDGSEDGPTITVVLGDMRASNVITAGLLEIRGDLLATEAVVGDYNDGGVLVHGDLTTDLFMPVEISYAVRGALRAGEEIPAFTTQLAFVPKRLAPRYFLVTGEGATLFGGEAGDTYVEALASGESILAG